MSTPSPPPFSAPHPSSCTPAIVPAPTPVHTAVPRDNSPRSILLPSGSGSARLEHSHAPVPPYRSRTSSSGPNIPPNIPAISTLPIPTISSLPATATTAATPLSPASTTSLGDGDEDVDVDPVIGSRYGADTALTESRPQITQEDLKQSVSKIAFIPQLSITSISIPLTFSSYCSFSSTSQ
ncbi:hypothetical protein F5890DRAFT_1499710 [Lentinula detonsa]|uniref:Uncharacterized protein n=1 Tax=Lentinula detonsa TaxID=2804962 RepID=A0AA38UUM0_9AGAR|nr:hypothetical protein F5890DRAFT_1499710 [Lentinula detonsa]